MVVDEEVWSDGEVWSEGEVWSDGEVVEVGWVPGEVALRSTDQVWGLWVLYFVVRVIQTCILALGSDRRRCLVLEHPYT